MRRSNLVWVVGVVALIALVGYAPSAKADDPPVLFGCDSVGALAPACSGTVTGTGPFSSSNIKIFNLTGQYVITDTFTLSFNTNTGTISMTDGTNTLTGTILSSGFGPAGFGSGLDSISMAVSWTSLPTAVCAAGGNTAPCAGTGVFTDVTFQINPDTGTVEVVHIAITPIPEPGSLALFGSGLVVMGGILRRKIGSLISRS